MDVEYDDGGNRAVETASSEEAEVTRMSKPARDNSNQVSPLCDTRKRSTSGDELNALRAAFPAWSLFRSDAGVFYATRRGVHLRNADIDKGLRQTVSADDVTTFVSLLEDQTRMMVRS
ncbi:hypothetical protein ACIBQ1_08470 [Nonomuraea sp. NPDC050153]|uniref:hypothetical protein n=1 Tax=Nonomuraea sp. NPDC050153 TaxID=3364359 RepID=UPI0037BCEF4B